MINDLDSRFERTKSGFTVRGLRSEDTDDVYDYFVDFAPFQISQHTNARLSSRTAGSLYFEDQRSGKSRASGEGVCFDALRGRAMERSGMDIYTDDDDEIKQSVSWGFYLPGEE